MTSHPGKYEYSPAGLAKDIPPASNPLKEWLLELQIHLRLYFTDNQKAYDTVWMNGLWYEMWEMGTKGKMWRVGRS